MMKKQKYDKKYEQGSWHVYRNIPGIGQMLIGAFSEERQADSFIKEMHLHEKEFKHRIRQALD